MVRSISLFVHLVGTLALFAGFGVEWLAHSDAIQPALRRLSGAGSHDSPLRTLPRVARTQFRVSLGAGLNGRASAHGYRRSSQTPGSLPLRAGMALAALSVMIARLDLVESLAVLLQPSGSVEA